MCDYFSATLFCLTVLLMGCSDSDDPTIPVDKVTFDKYEIELVVGDAEILTVAVFPENATNKTLVWYSSKIFVAAVNGMTGKVIAITPGTAVITAMTEDGVKAATCTVTVIPAPVEIISATGEITVTTEDGVKTVSRDTNIILAD